MTTIMVQMAARHWTFEAVHMAAAIARSNSTDIYLVRMIPVQHIAWLGTALGQTGISKGEYAEVEEYRKTAEDYGVGFFLAQMQYHTLSDAIADAAENLDADLIFATLPAMKLRLWRKFLLWQITRRLHKQQRRLITLEPDARAEAWTPSVTLTSPEKAEASSRQVR